MKKSVLSVIICWILIILGFVISQETILFSGEEFFLKTKPYDPRDLMRGDYVNLTYEISTISYKKKDFYPNMAKPVYVILKKDENNIASYYDISLERPKSGLFIKGSVKSKFLKKLEITYGIESYFVKQKTLREIERELSKGGFAKIKVDKFGRAKIIGLKAF